MNNYFYDNAGHAFELDTGGDALVEGNVFQAVDTVYNSPIDGQLFTSPDPNTNADCTASLGRACVINGFGASSTVTQTNTGFLVNFKGKSIASASAYTSVVASVTKNAGQGKL